MNPTVVISGVPNLALSLKKSGAIDNVFDCPSTSTLKGVITGSILKGIQSSSLVFIVGDAVIEDDLSFPISDFLRKVTAAGYNVIIVSVTPKGMELYKQNPKSVLLHLPITVNSVLYAISTFGLNLSPIMNGTVEVDVTGKNSGNPSTNDSSLVGSHSVDQATNNFVNKGWTSINTGNVTQTSSNSYAPSGSPAISSHGLTPDLSNGVNYAVQGNKNTNDFMNSQTTVGTGTENNTRDTQPFFSNTPNQQVQGVPLSAQQPNPYQDPAQHWGIQQANQPVWPNQGSVQSSPNPTFNNKDAQRQGSQTSESGQFFSTQPNGTSLGGGWTPPQRTLSDFGGRTLQDPNMPPSQQYPTSINPNSNAAFPQYSSNQFGTPWSPSSRVGANLPVKPSRRGYVITISVSKGGTGKSSMTLNLAAFLGMRLRSQGKTVCVIDANTQQADSGKYLDVYHPNISTIVNDPNLLTEDRILSALVHRPEYNLSVLLGPSTPDEANPLAINPRLYSEVLDLLKTHFDYVLIDTPVAEKFHEMFSEFALAKADYLVVPVTQNVQTLHNADNWLRAAVIAPRHEGGAAFDRNRIGIVLNRAEEGVGFSEDDVRATMANWHYIGSIPETKEWKLANNRNELVAPKNFADLSHAFAEVLHAATSEPSLLENFSTLDIPKQSFFDKILGKVFNR